MTSSAIGTGSMLEAIHTLAAVIWWMLVFGFALTAVVFFTAVAWYLRERWENRDRRHLIAVQEQRARELVEREQSRIVRNVFGQDWVELERVWELPAIEPRRRAR